MAVFQKGRDGGWGAYVPDLPGCAALGRSKRETERLIREAVPQYIESLRRHGETVPKPGRSTAFIEVS
ncbi:MAG: type II toxin-antitoxin system HicB family antitoxin [Candidatus Eremiobacteraeota bacterium]|nr:type II toxin-antitoxin system HicB family antitoxin [Candidatus Eremiobacteraeota bacterium]